MFGLKGLSNIQKPSAMVQLIEYFLSKAWMDVCCLFAAFLPWVSTHLSQGEQLVKQMHELKGQQVRQMVRDTWRSFVFSTFFSNPSLCLVFLKVIL